MYQYYDNSSEESSSEEYCSEEYSSESSDGFYTAFDVYVINGSEKQERQDKAQLIFQAHEDMTYENLLSKLYQCFPFLRHESHYLTGKDEYDNALDVFDDETLHTVLNEFDDCSLYVLYNDEARISTENSFDSHYYCNQCCFVLKHFRHKCTSCPEYDLCSSCVKAGVHNEHEFEYLDIVTSEDSPALELEEINIWGRNHIGEGGFGVVYSAYDSGTNEKVAVKFFKDSSELGSEDIGSFMSELKACAQAGENINVVKTLGYCFDIPYGTRNLGLVMECVTMVVDGQEISGLMMYLMYLRKLFKRDRKDLIDRRELDSFALQIARGMAHLERKNILHRDLAARNVLIDDNKNLKISDFGLSRVGDYYQGGDFSIFADRWAAPEIMKYQRYSNKSDVWAFGIVLWEIATLGGFPYAGIEDVGSYVVKGKRLWKPESMSNRLFDIMSRCWTGRPENRPDFSDLVDKFLDFKWLAHCFLDFESLDDFDLPYTLEMYESKF